MAFVFFSLLPQKEEKSQHKERNGVTDVTPVQTAPPPKPSLPDALKASIVSLPTISNINVDIQVHEDLMKIEVQGPQSVVSHHWAVNKPVTYSKGRGKADASPPPSPVKPHLKSVSAVVSRGRDEGRASNGLLHIHPQDMPNPGGTFSVCREKQMTDVDDTMELLKEADMHNSKLEMEKKMDFSITERKSEHKSNLENIGVVLEDNRDNKNDTVTLLKEASSQHHTSDIQVGALSKRSDYVLL